MKTVYDLVDDWESGTLTEQDVAHLKTLMKERAVRAQVRAELCFYGLLHEVLKTETTFATAPAPSPEPGVEPEEIVEWETPGTQFGRRLRGLFASPFFGFFRSARAWTAIVALLLGISAVGIYLWPRPVAYISTPGGMVQILHAGRMSTGLAGTKLYSGDSLRTAPYSSAMIQWKAEQTALYLSPETEIELKQTGKGKIVSLARGTLHAKVVPQQKQRPLKVTTPVASAIVVGTRFKIVTTSTNSYLGVVEGAVEFKETGFQPVTVRAGQYSMAGRGSQMQVLAMDGLLWEVWVAGTGPLSSDAPTPSSLIHEDYVFMTQTLVWDYPFLYDKSKPYRERFRGYLAPSETGDYVFWMMSQTASELWLSTDSSETNKTLIASTPAPPPGAPLKETWNWARRPGMRQTFDDNGPFNKFPSQKSKPVHLVAGQRYYLEALHEAISGDCMTVVWAVPGQDQRIPTGSIPMSVLVPPRP